MTAFFFDLDDTLFDYQFAKNSAIADFRMFSRRDNLALVDAIALWDEVTVKYMEQYHSGLISYSEQQQKRIAAFLALNVTPEEAQSWYLRYQTIYESHWRLFDDVLPVIEVLAQSASLAIITDGPHHQQQKKLAVLAIDHFFDHMTIPLEVGAPKPEAKLFLRAAEKAGREPHQCWYIGNDYRKDYCGARDAGFHSVWLTRSGNYDETARHCKDLHEFLGMVERFGELS
jgi:putative hydrolase of the HAD superfamily